MKNTKDYSPDFNPKHEEKWFTEGKLISEGILPVEANEKGKVNRAALERAKAERGLTSLPAMKRILKNKERLDYLEQERKRDVEYGLFDYAKEFTGKLEKISEADPNYKSADDVMVSGKIDIIDIDGDKPDVQDNINRAA